MLLLEGYRIHQILIYLIYPLSTIIQIMVLYQWEQENGIDLAMSL